MLKKLIRMTMILGGFYILPGCAGITGPDYRTWQEEVKLNDGRVIVVTQKKRCTNAVKGKDYYGPYIGCIARETWLTINLPEFSAQPIVWHEKLDPRILNIHNGRLYVVGIPPTGYEFNLWGKPQPPYIGFVWEDGQWRRLLFVEIPEAVYDTNMLIESIPRDGKDYLTWATKQSIAFNGAPEYRKPQKRIDPTYRSN